jgi:hypothetical protein
MTVRNVKFAVMIFCFLISVLSVSAQQSDRKKESEQESINRQMTLEREYDPIVQDAAKINTLPKVYEMVVSKRPIVYSDFVVPFSPEKDIIVLPSAAFMTDVDTYSNNGYLHFAGGMLMNFSGDFGYHLLNNDRDLLKIFFSHRSTNGNVKFDNEVIDKRKAKLNDNMGGIDFKHRFDASTLSLGGKFGYSAFNYYGLPTNNDVSSLRSIPDTATNQGNRLINVYAGIASNKASSTGYHIGVDYTNFGQKYSLHKDLDGISENNIGLNLGLSSPVSDGKRFGVDLKANFLSYSEPSPLTQVKVDSSGFDTRYETTLSPYFKMDFETVKLKLGINLMLVSQAETEFFVSPNITLDVPFSNNSLFYLDFGGGIESNTMAEISQLNRYLNPAFMPDASETWADLKIGVNSNVSHGLWFGLYGGFKYTESDVFYNPSSYSRIDDGFNNVSMIFQPNSQRFQLGASIKYTQDIFDFYLNGQYNYYSLKNVESWKNSYVMGIEDLIVRNEDMKAYGKPAAVVNAGIKIRPLKPLSIGVDYSMLSGMYAYVNMENVKMKTVNDMKLRASWTFSNSFGIYAQLNNLLFQKHEMFYGYPLQPFNAMGGFNFNF